MSEDRSYRLDPGYPFGASMAVVPIDLYTTGANDEEVLIGSATSFCDVLGSQRYLITNWHNVTGRDPATGQPREKDGVIPTFVRAHFLKALTSPEGQSQVSPWETVSIDFPIEVFQATNWIMHQEGQSIDLAALALPEDTRVHFRAMSKSIGVFEPYLEVGAEVFILGFPRGLRPTGSLPIWKRGSIATEPYFGAYTEPCFLIDAATREGMSGSPIVARAVTKVEMDKIRAPLTLDTPIIQYRGLSFVGVYSGRVGVKDALEAQLGRVWRAELIREMLTNPKPLDWELRRVGAKPDQVTGHPP
jgi:hypothetical protein